MTLFRSIICPVDFSEHSIEAFRFALGLAGRHQSRLTVLTVNAPLLVEAAAAAQYGADYVAHEAKKELRGIVSSIVPSGAAWAPAPQIAVRTGEPHTEILKCAAEQDADLIVMGTHGLGGYRKMFFGSVTERVLRHSSISVLAVPRATHELVVLTNRVPTFNLSRVMVPVDFGPSSGRQIQLAAELARSFGIPLLVVHILEEIRAHGGLHDAVQTHERQRAEKAREWLCRLASAPGDGVVAETHVEYGNPANEIARIAVATQVGLIVMGLTGGGASAGRPGTVAYRVLTLAPAPVLALPAGKDEVGKSP